MTTIRDCYPYEGPNTGFEDVEYYRSATQIGATIIIATTFFLLQILMLLLFLPIPQFPRFLRRIDIEFNLLEFSARTKNQQIGSEEDQLIESDIIEQNKRSKKASGGLATLVIVVIVIVISTTSFVVTQDGPGSITYQSNKLISRELKEKFYLPIASVGMTIKTYSNSVQLVYKFLTYGETGNTRKCNLEKVETSAYGPQTYSFDVVRLGYYGDWNEKTFIYVTACQQNITRQQERESINTILYTPVRPSLSQYPPPGIFADRPIEGTTKQTLNNRTPVLPYKWTWVEMVSSSAFDLVSAVKAERYIQPKLSPQPVQTRGPNDTFTVRFETSEVSYTWPECNVLGPTYKPLFSFNFDLDPNAFETQSYIVSESSILSWAFATIVTIGSVIALKPTIAYYLQKFHNYWTMKGWLRWLLFSIYTVLIPGPFLYIVHLVISFQPLALRGERQGYFYRMQDLLLILSLLLMVTWIGVLARHIKTAVDVCKRKKQAAQINNSIMEQEELSKVKYITIP